MPYCSSVSMICLASDGDEAIMDPAPFLDDNASLSLVIKCLKCMAALVMLENLFVLWCWIRTVLCHLRVLW